MSLMRGSWDSRAEGWDGERVTPPALSDVRPELCRMCGGEMPPDRSGMIKASERDARRVHPTQKPVALMAWLIRSHTKPGDLVLDPYMGSGPTLRAAMDLSRRAIGIEMEERYCEAAVRRLEEAFDGVKPAARAAGQSSLFGGREVPT